MWSQLDGAVNFIDHHRLLSGAAKKRTWRAADSAPSQPKLSAAAVAEIFITAHRGAVKPKRHYLDMLYNK